MSNVIPFRPSGRCTQAGHGPRAHNLRPSGPAPAVLVAKLELLGRVRPSALGVIDRLAERMLASATGDDHAA